MSALIVVPCTLREANSYVEQVHRHHRPARGCLFTLAAARGDVVVGVAIVGRPTARLLQDGFTAEVVRVATASVRAAGWRLIGEAGGGSWSRVRRARSSIPIRPTRSRGPRSAC
jgi:hypothetical protein